MGSPEYRCAKPAAGLRRGPQVRLDRPERRSGDHAIEQAAGEHGQVDMRGLRTTVRREHRTRLYGEHRPLTVGVGRAAPEGAEAVGAAYGAACVVGVVEAAIGIGLPRLDQAVRDGCPGAVHEPATQPDPAWRFRRHRERAVLPHQPDRQVRPDGLRRRQLARSFAGILEWRAGGSPEHDVEAVGHRPRRPGRRQIEGTDEPPAGLIARDAREIGSWSKSGSSGKYICVTSRCMNARPNREKWMCAGRQALS